MRAIARLLGHFLWNLALCAGWVAFTLVLLLTLAERSGMLADALRDALHRRAGALPVTLQAARVAWFDTRIDLVGLQVGDGTGAVHLDTLEVHWGLASQSGFEIRGLVVRAGRARITNDLVQALEQRFGGGAGAASS